MPVAFGASAVGHYIHTLLSARNQLKAGVEQESAPGAYQGSEMCEPFEIALLVAIDVEMVRVGRCHDCNRGGEVME
jgi:hypothetical protein